MLCGNTICRKMFLAAVKFVQFANKATELCFLIHWLITLFLIARFLEIFESAELQGEIFFETVVNYVQHQGGRKLQSQLKDIVNNNRQQSIIFSKEFCDGAYVPREPRETLEDWQWRPKTDMVKKSCSYKSITRWNALENQMRSIQDVDAFKKSLKCIFKPRML